MDLVVKTRMGKKNMLYIPKAVAEAVGLKEDSTVVMQSRGSVKNPFPFTSPQNCFGITVLFPHESCKAPLSSALLFCRTRSLSAGKSVSRSVVVMSAPLPLLASSLKSDTT